MTKRDIPNEAQAVISDALEHAEDISAELILERLKSWGLTIVPIEPSDAMLRGACKIHEPGKPMSKDYQKECPKIANRRRIYKKMVRAAVGGGE